MSQPKPTLEEIKDRIAKIKGDGPERLAAGLVPIVVEPDDLRHPNPEYFTQIVPSGDDQYELLALSNHGQLYFKRPGLGPWNEYSIPPRCKYSGKILTDGAMCGEHADCRELAIKQ